MLLLSAVAAAAPGILLPAGEDPARWATAARLAGVTVGCGPADCVTVSVSAAGWTLIAGAGARRSTVAAPTDEADRRAVAALAASLAAPPPAWRWDTPAPPPPPPQDLAPAPPPPPPEVAAALPHARHVAVHVPVAGPTPVEPALPATETSATGPFPEPPRVALSVRIGTGARLSTLDPAGVARVGVGARRGPWRAELVGQFAQGPVRAWSVTETRWDLGAAIGWTPRRYVALALDVGAAHRAWVDTTTLGALWTPTVGLSAQAVVPVGRLDLWVGPTLQLDLRPVRVVGIGPGETLSPAAVTISGALVY